MKEKDIIYIRDVIDDEGFEYAFVDYSDFNEIKDEIFHSLRLSYLKARSELDVYIGGYRD